MIAVALAALSAASYGASDFSGAVASKENDASSVTIVMQAISLCALGVVLVVWPHGQTVPADLAWGAVGGLGAALGLVTFYRALAIGPMSVAAALTALWSTIIPVGAGLALGDRPGPVTLTGIAIAIPAAVLVSLEAGDGGPAPVTPVGDRLHAWEAQAVTRRLAVLAGIGFGLFFVALSRTSADAGLQPLVAARVASISGLAIVLARSIAGSSWSFPSRPAWPAVAIAGLLDCTANSTYLIALRHGSFTWVAAVSSLYPVATVVLARVVLKERLVRVQLVGMVAAAIALLLIGLGAT